MAKRKQKLKTKKAATKRFKVTATGKIMRRPSGIGHLKAKQTGKKRRQKRGWVPVSKAEAKKLKKMMPYK